MIRLLSNSTQAHANSMGKMTERLVSYFYRDRIVRFKETEQQHATRQKCPPINTDLTVDVCSSVQQHLHHGLVPTDACIHERGHALKSNQKHLSPTEHMP